MFRRLRVTGPVAWAMMLVLAVMSSANCLLASDMTPAQKACCAAMAHDCGEMAIQQNCCAGEGTTAQNLSPAMTAGSVAPPPAVLVAVLEPLVPSAASTSAFDDSSSGPVKPPGAPTYLLVSAFRI